MDTKDIFQDSFEQQGINSAAEISACVLGLLSSAALTALNNLIQDKIEVVSSKLSSTESQINDAQAEISILDGTDMADAVGGNATAIATLYNKFSNPFKMGTIDVTCIGSIPDLFGIAGGLGDFLDSDSFGADLTKVLLAMANLVILQAIKAALVSVMIKLLSDAQSVSNVLSGRADGSIPEPEIDYDRPDIANYLSYELDDYTTNRIADYREFVQTKVVEPFLESQAADSSLRAQLLAKSDKEVEDLFDLTFGPPISTHGQYILSRDGLYYDSRHGGVPDVVAEQILASNWKLEYAPNKGGKGFQFGEGLKDYSNTVFSSKFTEVNPTVDFLYDNDDILQTFVQDKSKHINDVSGQVRQLLDGGYDASSAIVQNYYHSVGALAATYDKKIAIRRKQLQIAGLYGPFSVTPREFPIGEGYILEETGTETDTSSYPEGWFYDEGDGGVTYNANGVVLIGRIINRVPINDFRWLEGTGLVPDLEVQDKYLISSEDVDDVVLPLKAKFYHASRISTLYVKDFNVSPEATTDWVRTLDAVSGYGGVSSIQPFVKSLDDEIEKNGLLACYNFLQGKTESPSSVDYKLDNTSKSTNHFNGKLVARGASSVFVSGVSIPHLRGTIYDADKLYSPEPWYGGIGQGSYVRMPNNVKDGNLNIANAKLDNLTYNQDGFTLDFWCHIPDVHAAMTRSHRYRVVMGCENTGLGTAAGAEGNTTITANPNTIMPNGITSNTRDPNKTHGMVIGFRDKTYSAAASGQAIDTNLQFCVLPTVSQNHPNGMFGDSACIAEYNRAGYTASAGAELGFKIGIGDSTSEGTTIRDVSSGFHHMALSFDYEGDTVTCFMDGNVLATSSIAKSFQLDPGQPLNVPSMASVGGTPYMNSLGVASGNTERLRLTESLHEGTSQPPAYPMFTPWVIGGGFTDSAPRQYTMEQTLGFNTTPVGFLGTNTNSTYYSNSVNATTGGYAGQHDPPIGGFTYAGVSRDIARSGLDGYLGSFKVYTRALSTNEVIVNYDAQKGFFTNILT
jgi:hypothetical protein